MIKFYINSVLIAYDPQGWEDDILEITRTKNRGLFREASQNLKFIKDGAKILRELVYTGGVDSEITFKVERQNRQTLQNETVFEGNFDLTTFKDNIYDVECTALDNTLAGKLKAKKDHEYEISLTDEEDFAAVFYAMNTKVNWQGSPDTFTSITPPNTVAYVSLELALQNIEWIGETFATFKLQWSGTPDMSTNYSCLEVQQTTKIKGVLKLQGKILYQALSNDVTIEIILAKNDLSEVKVLKTISTTEDFGYDIDEVLEIDDTLNYTSTETNYWGVWIWLRCPDQLFDAGLLQGFNNDLNLDLMGRVTSNFKVIKAKNLIQALLDKMQITNELQSNILDSLPDDSQPVFTYGLAMRRARGGANQLVRCSLQQVLDCLFSVYNYSSGMDGNKFSVEPFAYFYDDSQIYDIGECNDITITPIEHFTEIQAGYPDQSPDMIEGLNEINSEQTWELPFNVISGKRENVMCQTRADIYGIMRAVMNGLEKKIFKRDEGDVLTMYSEPTKDYSFDNTLFVFDAEKTEVGNMIFSRNKVTSLIGFDFALETFNLAISPKRNLLRHLNWITALAFGTTGTEITQTTALKNVNLTTTIDGLTVNEQTPIDFDFENSLFLPFFCQVQFAQPNEMIEIIKNAKERGLFSWTFQNNKYYGYVEEMRIKIARRDEINCKFVLANIRENDITNLIRP